MSVARTTLGQEPPAGSGGIPSLAKADDEGSVTSIQDRSSEGFLSRSRALSHRPFFLVPAGHAAFQRAGGSERRYCCDRGYQSRSITIGRFPKSATVSASASDRLGSTGAEWLSTMNAGLAARESQNPPARFGQLPPLRSLTSPLLAALTERVLNAFDDRRAAPSRPSASAANILAGDARQPVSPINLLVEKITEDEVSRLHRLFDGAGKRA